MNRNNYSKLHQNYVPCECNRCNQYQIFKTQLNCPKQTRQDYKEPFGSFSISAAGPAGLETRRGIASLP